MHSTPEPAAGFLAHRGLMAFAAVTAMAEAGLLSAVAPAARALAPQVTALPPLAVFHDLRWLYSEQRSWLTFAALLAGMVLARSAVIVVLVRLAWPAKSAVPAPLEAMRCAVIFTVFTSLLISPLVSLTLGVAVLPFSWPFLASLPVMLLITLPLSHGGVVSNWWRMLPPPAAVGWLLADFVVLSFAATAMGRLPFAATVPIAGLAGLFNARAWYGLTTAVVLAHGRPFALVRTRGYWRTGTWQFQRIPVTPLATVVAILVTILLARLAFLASVPAGETVNQDQAAGPAAAAGPGTAGHPRKGTSPGREGPSAILEIPGFGSHCCARNLAIAQTMHGILVQQFSYRGLDRAGNPLPYGPSASNLPLPVLGDRVAAQVWRLHARTGRPVEVVAESEGTLGVYAMLARHPDVPVADVVLLSPIVAPGQVSYPVGGGAAMVPGGELQAVVWFVGGLSPFGTSGAQTLIASVNRYGARFAAAAARHRGLRLLELVPLADAVTLPACRLPSNVLVLPAMHGQLLGDPAALRIVRGFLYHQPVSATPGLRGTAEIVAATATAWRIPQASAPSPPCAR
jgi:hypothetical protein